MTGKVKLVKVQYIERFCSRKEGFEKSRGVEK